VLGELPSGRQRGRWNPLLDRKTLASTVAVLAVGSGLTRIWRRRRHRRGDFRAYVLEYHEISADGTEAEGTISAARFRRHLAHLARRYRPATVAEAAQRLSRGLEEDLVVITFDDGYAGNREAAWPELRTAGMPATIFLTTGFLDGAELWFDRARRQLTTLRQLAVGRSAGGWPSTAREMLAEALGSPPPESVESLTRELKYLPPPRREALLSRLAEIAPPRGESARPLSWDDARALQGEGAELGGHTVSHPILSTVGAAEQEAEIRTSRERIAEELGSPPVSFAYPNGSARDFGDETVSAVERAGFRAACTTVRGSNRPGCDLLRLRRIGIGSDSTTLVEARLAGLFDQEVRRLLGFAKGRPRT